MTKKFIIPNECYLCGNSLAIAGSDILICNNSSSDIQRHFAHKEYSEIFELLNFDKTKLFIFNKDIITIYNISCRPFIKQVKQLKLSINCFDDIINFIKNFSLIE